MFKGRLIKNNDKIFYLIHLHQIDDQVEVHNRNTAQN